MVEREAVKSLLRGADVSRGEARPSAGLLFFHDCDHVSTPIASSEAARAFPRAFEFIAKFEDILRSRRRFRAFDPSGEDWLGIYSVTTAALARHKVVVREIATGMLASPVDGADLIPDHKLYVIPCRSRTEAVRLADVLNSPVVDYLVRSFVLSTSISGSFLRYVGVTEPSADKWNGSPERMAEALGLPGDVYNRLNAIAKRELSTSDWSVLSS